MNKYLLSLLSGAILLGLSGCRPAVLVIPSYIKTVGVDRVDNRTSWFALDTQVKEAILRNFQLDGRVGIEDADKADLVVKVIIREFREDPIFYDPKTNAVQQYQETLVYDIAAVDTQEKKTFLEDNGKNHSIYYYTNYYPGAIQQTRDQAIAQLEDEMARLIVRRVLEGY